MQREPSRKAETKIERDFADNARGALPASLMAIHTTSTPLGSTAVLQALAVRSFTCTGHSEHLSCPNLLKSSMQSWQSRLPARKPVRVTFLPVGAGVVNADFSVFRLIEISAVSFDSQRPGMRPERHTRRTGSEAVRVLSRTRTRRRRLSK